MGHSKDKAPSKATAHGKSKKRKRDNAGDDLLRDVQSANPRDEDGIPAKKRKGHRAHRAGELLAPPPADKDEETKTVEKESVPVAETPKRNKPVAGKNRRDKGNPENDGEKPKRFIVFIGNLPFTATTASVSKHFASLKPASVRHITHKDQPTKSKGYAFLEFDGYDRMKTCLKLHHQSTFDDGLSAARKINVELTAGGGGAKSGERRAKLKARNQKLNEERIRRSLEEEKAKQAKQDKRTVVGENSDVNGVHSVHPSRRGRVPTT
ncbi:MAG: hypothetical protein M1839_000624 [Geoglossum umbratile]|nr:MAG: hypothetical protein M1839_000624 [Geoglossum umbratile]